ncbi:porin family protein [Membranihabitans marinus]|uniref:hypothetical protein n=1 Tax=Membranihabitans marinus TaxID=1227546 RepID=UPI001F41C247|nr:hypothetical protein [Membranihabitans marinus]
MIRKIILLTLLTSSALYGQNQNKELPTSEVEVVKDFEARLVDAKRISIEPTTTHKVESEQTFQYKVEDHQESITYNPPVIKPMAFRMGDGPDPYAGYLKLGAGYPLNYLVQGGYNIFVNESIRTNLFTDVRGIQDHEIESRNALNIDFRGDLDFYSDLGVKINGYIGYKNNQYQYYNPAEEIIDSSLTVDKIKYTDFLMGVKINNYEENDLGIDYSLAVEGLFLKTNFAQKNNTFNLLGNIHKKFGDHWLASLNLNSFNDHYKEEAEIKQNYFEFNPFVQYSSGNIKVKAGAMLLSSGSDTGIKPDVELEYSMLNNRLNIFVGATGKYKVNSFRSFLNENPFMDHVFDSLFLSDINDYYVGVKGSMTGINYNLKGGFRSIKDLAVYNISSQDPYILYAPIFDDAKNTYVELSVSMPIIEKLNAYALVRYDNYKMDVLESAYYIPTTKVQLGGKYGLLNGKLNLGLDFSFLSAVDHPENMLMETNSVFDVNINGEYLFTDNFGAFLQFNNLADSKYIRWQDYQGIGINAVAGISVRFK